MAKVTFNKNICKGCGLCVEACPLDLLALDKEEINRKGYSPAVILYPEKCVGCASCAIMCPDSVITVER